MLNIDIKFLNDKQTDHNIVCVDLYWYDLCVMVQYNLTEAFYAYKSIIYVNK